MTRSEIEISVAESLRSLQRTVETVPMKAVPCAFVLGGLFMLWTKLFVFLIMVGLLLLAGAWFIAPEDRMPPAH